MDCCSKYTDYNISHPMASRVSEAMLSNGPPNRIAPNVTVVAGHRHHQALRYHEQQQRLAALHSSERLYHHQHYGFDRYLPAVNYPDYHPSPYGTAGLNFENLGRRSAAAYLNHHTHHAQHSHHLYHPPHYDSTYNGRMIGGAGSVPYHPYRESYEHQPGGPTSVLHYASRSSAFQYGHQLTSASSASQQREYLHYYQYHSIPYDQQNLNSINELQHQSSKNDGQTYECGQHITETKASYAQQQQQLQQQSGPVTSSFSPLIASPMASGSTTTDSGISGSSRCGSTPISTVATSGRYSGEYFLNFSSTVGSEEGSASGDGQQSLPATPDVVDEGRSNKDDHQFSPKPIRTKSSPSSSQTENVLSGKLCASSQSKECSTPMVPTQECCGSPYISSTRPTKSFQSPHRYKSAHNKWSPNICETNESSSFSIQPFSQNPIKSRTFSPLSVLNSIGSKQNRVVECDLIKSRKSKRRLDTPQTVEVREKIPDIKPLPGFQQAFGSTEIGRFFETFLNIPASPYDSVYSYESEADTMSPQPWEIENSVDGSEYDMQISASLQSVYKNSITDKNYLSSIRCNGL